MILFLQHLLTAINQSVAPNRAQLFYALVWVVMISFGGIIAAFYWSMQREIQSHRAGGRKPEK